MAPVRASVGPSAGQVGVVIFEADPSNRRALAGMIAERSNGRFVARAFANPAEARAAGHRGDAIVIADLDTIGGPAALGEFAGGAHPLIAISSNGSLNTAIAAMKGGANDFLSKPVGAKALLEKLEAALLAPQAKRVAVAAPAPAPARVETDFASFIGRSVAMQAVYEQIRRMAPSRAPVFITGESGTGKELCAEAIHSFSGGLPATDRPFIAINCSAIPKELMESEIFGHVKGAFTGASDNRTGAAELADGGTLFLDELAEMDLGLQAKLLRFLQTGTLRRVGGNELKRVDVRIVCATNRDPLVEVEAGRFRADLFYRLHVLPIHLPPLRDRDDDIMALANAALTRYAAEEGRAFSGFAAEAAARLRGHTWPGNVRELTNAIRRIVVLDDGVEVTVEMLPPAIRDRRRIATEPDTAPPVAARSDAPATIVPFWQEERRVIEAALAAFGGNIGRAAAALEISPSTIYRKRLSWPSSNATGA